MPASRNPVGWFEIYVNDITRAKDFYQGTFEVELQQLDSGDLEMWAFPMIADAPGCPGSLVKMNGFEAKPGGTIIYFSCEDCAIVAERAVKFGARLHKPKFSIGDYGFISFVYDTEGNLIGLHSRK